MTLLATGPQASLALTLTWTCAIRWFGGHRVAGMAFRDSMTGGFVSWTVTRVLQVAGAATPSDTCTVMSEAPSGKTVSSTTLVAVGGVPAGIEFVWTGAPLTCHTTCKASPSASSTLTETEAGVPLGEAHSRAAGSGQVTLGA